MKIDNKAIIQIGVFKANKTIYTELNPGDGKKVGKFQIKGTFEEFTGNRPRKNEDCDGFKRKLQKEHQEFMRKVKDRIS